MYMRNLEQESSISAGSYGIFYNTGRQGEYVESSCRPGSSRGLKYKVSPIKSSYFFCFCLNSFYQDMSFICFRNEDGNPEFALRLTKDAKLETDFAESRRS
jgi:hypothetical protein